MISNSEISHTVCEDIKWLTAGH